MNKLVKMPLRRWRGSLSMELRSFAKLQVSPYLTNFQARRSGKEEDPSERTSASTATQEATGPTSAASGAVIIAEVAIEETGEATEAATGAETEAAIVVVEAAPEGTTWQRVGASNVARGANGSETAPGGGGGAGGGGEAGVGGVAADALTPETPDLLPEESTTEDEATPTVTPQEEAGEEEASLPSEETQSALTQALEAERTPETRTPETDDQAQEALRGRGKAPTLEVPPRLPGVAEATLQRSASPRPNPLREIHLPRDRPSHKKRRKRHHHQ